MESLHRAYVVQHYELYEWLCNPSDTDESPVTSRVASWDSLGMN